MHEPVGCVRCNGTGYRGRVGVYLLDDETEIDETWLEGVRTLGITAGASAPEVLVREVVGRLAERYAVTEEPVEGVEENMIFKLPAGLRAA